MGNVHTNFNYLYFQNHFLDEKYFFEIDFDEFDIDIIKQKLELLANNPSFGNKNMHNVLTVLNHIKSIEHIEMLQQINGYLFQIYGGAPLLAIRNTNAAKYQLKNGINVIENRGYFYRCNLSKVYTNYNWFW